MLRRILTTSLVLMLMLFSVNIFCFIPNLAPAALADTPIFGPERVLGKKAGVGKIIRNFSVTNLSRQFTLNVQNGDGKRGKFSSASIELNGVNLGNVRFDATKDLWAVPVTLHEQNEIAIEVTSTLDTSVIVTILAVGNANPVASASSATPNLSQVTASDDFDACLQDDSSNDVFRFNSTNGTFLSLTKNFSTVLFGQGTVTVKGSIMTLQENTSERRVLARIDKSVNKGTASIQIFSQGITTTITDRNTTNNICPFLIDGVGISPDAVFIGEAENITAKAAISYNPSQGTPLVTLIRLDANGNTVGTEGNLTDDGNLGNGDEIAGDGVFSLRKLFSSSREERINLRIVFQQGTRVGVSTAFTLDVITHLSESQLNTALNLQNVSLQNYNSLVPSIGKEAARDAVLSQIRQSPDVIQAGISENGNGIWMVYSSGIPGVLMLNPGGTRGGPGVPRSAGALREQAAMATASEDISNRKAIVLAPQNAEFGSSDEAPDIRQMLMNSSCPKFDVTYLTNSAVTVDVMKTLYQFGTVVITTHGDTYYKGILSLWQERWKWSFIGAQVAFFTGQQVTTANRVTYERDLKQGRIAVGTLAGGPTYAILPSFISFYDTNSYPDSLVYIGSCRSTFNASMSNAFLGSGAKTYLGYSEYVDSGFAGNVGRDFFHRFIETANILNTGDAFISGQHDNNSPPAFFQLRGSSMLAKPSSDLENGGFEDLNFGAWQPSGDGRVISQLGEFRPTEGLAMAVISTGLGFTVTSGSIEQKVCLPANAQRLEFNWNFNSEEFIEYCGSIFQDFFQVDIITDTGTQTFFFRKVDDLCGSVRRTSLHFDASSGNCSAGAGNDCAVWTTDWQSASLDISAIAAANQSKSVTIRFSAGDVGDSIFDTAVLLDKIKITTQ